MNHRSFFFTIVFFLFLQTAGAAEELIDPGLEQVDAEKLAAWTPYGNGYAIDAAAVHSGKFSIRCETADSRDAAGIVQVIRYEQPDTRPIIVGGWSKAEGVGPGGDYSVYLDILYDDGTPWWGKTAAWSRGSHDWQYTAEVYRPGKPVREIRVYVFLRRATGRAWFDDLFVHREGLHATQVRVMSDFPRSRFGTKILARLTGEADWQCDLLDSGRREIASRRGDGDAIVWDWLEPAEEPIAAMRLAGQTADGRRLDLEIPVELPGRLENPVRDGYVLWPESSMRKVYPTEFPPSKKEKPAEAVVMLARNEYEGMQLALTTADRTALQNVRIGFTPFNNEQGETLPPERIEAHLVGYVYVETPSGHPDAPASANWCPEVLLPLRPFDVPGGRTQTVWINFHAVEATAPGTYRGRVVVTPENAPPRELPIRVRVCRFTLPSSPRMKTAFAMMDGFTKATYGRITPELRRRSMDLMLSHRLNPDDISRTEPPAIEDLLYARQRGMNAFNIVNLVPKPEGDPLWVCYAERDAYPADFNEQLARRLDDTMRELRRQGLSDMAYFYGFDERGPEYDELIKGICKFLKERYPEVATFTTAGYMYQKRRQAPADYQDYMDWYCPLTSQYDPELSGRLRQQGKQVWWYVCCGPRYPYANFAAMDYPTIEGRLLGWMTYGFEADGLLFWHVNLWNRNRIITGDDPYLDWRPACVWGMTGDGCLTYPLPAGPVGSIRLENIRDGLEDYDWLAILADVRGRPFAMRYVDRLVESMTEFKRDPAALEAVRGEIANQIELSR